MTTIGFQKEMAQKKMIEFVGLRGVDGLKEE